MSEIIRSSYERALIEKNPLPREVLTDHFYKSLSESLDFFGKTVNDVFSNFTLDLWKPEEMDIDVYILSYALKKCLPKNSLYQDLVYVSGYTSTFGNYREKVYRLDIREKNDCLRKRTPEWVWANRSIVEEFMGNTKYINLLYKVRGIFPITITIIE